MRARALLLALPLLAGPALAATEGETGRSDTAPAAPEPAAIPEPVPVLAPVPSSGLSEEILGRMRERLTDEASRSREEEG